MDCNYVFGFFTLYLEIKILVIWNNHEYGVLMNWKGRCMLWKGGNDS
jgi:hypothetical protein